MALLLIPLALLVAIVIGVRVIQKGARPTLPPTAEEDARSIRKWDEAKRRGFMIHCVRSSLPLVIGYWIIIPLVSSWWQLGYIAYPMEQIPVYAVITLIISLVIGFLHWVSIRDSGEGAVHRRNLKQMNGRDTGHELA